MAYCLLHGCDWGRNFHMSMMPMKYHSAVSECGAVGCRSLKTCPILHPATAAAEFGNSGLDTWHVLHWLTPGTGHVHISRCFGNINSYIWWRGDRGCWWFRMNALHHQARCDDVTWTWGTKGCAPPPSCKLPPCDASLQVTCWQPWVSHGEHLMLTQAYEKKSGVLKLFAIPASNWWSSTYFLLVLSYYCKIKTLF